MIHQYLAGLFCTAGLILLALESLKPKDALWEAGDEPKKEIEKKFVNKLENKLKDRSANDCDWRFSLSYSISMLCWVLLGWMTDSASLVIIAVLQFSAAAVLLLAPRNSSLQGNFHL